MTVNKLWQHLFFIKIKREYNKLDENINKICCEYHCILCNLHLKTITNCIPYS